MVFEHAPEYPTQWGAIRSVAEKIGCPVEVLWRWVRQAERRANETLKEASAYFAQAELDRRAK